MFIHCHRGGAAVVDSLIRELNNILIRKYFPLPTEESHTMPPEQSRSALSVGSSVADTEDDDPHEAIVIKLPSTQTLADWE